MKSESTKHDKEVEKGRKEMERVGCELDEINDSILELEAFLTENVESEKEK
jgi:hypothetical protein